MGCVVAVLSMLLMLVVLTGCAGQAIQRKDGSVSARSFRFSSLAKSETDMLAEFCQREVLKSLRLLTEKLYLQSAATAVFLPL